MKETINLFLLWSVSILYRLMNGYIKCQDIWSEWKILTFVKFINICTWSTFPHLKCVTNEVSFNEAQLLLIFQKCVAVLLHPIRWINIYLIGLEMSFNWVADVYNGRTCFWQGSQMKKYSITPRAYSPNMSKAWILLPGTSVEDLRMLTLLWRTRESCVPAIETLMSSLF